MAGRGSSRIHKGNDSTSETAHKQQSERGGGQRARHAGPGILSLQHSAGNDAVNKLLSGGDFPRHPHAGALPPGEGKRLEPGTRARMEESFGQDFSDVRVHTGTEADNATRQVGARAYASGRSLVFGAGQYDPNTSEGRRLLAHELTHLAQQGKGIVEEGMTEPGHASEREAGKVADAVARGGRAPVIRATTARVARDVGWAQRGPIPDPYGEYLVLNAFAKKFEAAAKLIYASPAAMKLTKEAEAAGVTFGGYSEEGPGKDSLGAWPYTSGSSVYVPKARTDAVIAMSDFLFEINNAIRAPKFAELNKEAVKGSTGTLTAEQYAYKKMEQEMDGMFRLGEVWIETKKASGKGKAWDKYDSDFLVYYYNEWKAGRKSKDDLIKEALAQPLTTGTATGKTRKQFFMDQYKSLSGGK